MYCNDTLDDYLRIVHSKGRNPFKQFCIDKTFNYIGLNENPADANEVNMATICRTFDSIYQSSELVYNDIKENIESLIEDAIAIRNKYPK